MSDAAPTPARSRNGLAFWSWFIGEVISIGGTRITTIAIPWLVLTTTGSAADAGLVAFAEMLPLVLTKALGGPLIDRLGAVRLAVVLDTASALAFGAIPVLWVLGHLSFPVLLAVVAAAGALRGPGDAAKQSLAPALAQHTGMPLERVTGAASTIDRLANTFGAVLAGVLIATVGAAEALAVTAVGFFVSAAVYWRVLAPSLGWRPYAENQDGDDHEEDGQGYFRRLLTGWRFLRRDPVLVAITVMVMLTNLLDQAWQAVLVPVWVKDAGESAATIGLLYGVMSAAAVAGAILAATIAARMPRYWTYAIAYLVAGAPRFIAMGLESPTWVIIATFAIAGLASGFINPILSAIVFERLPSRLVGRVSSLVTALNFAGIPFGGLVGAALATGFGANFGLVAAGAAYAVVTLFPLFLPTWRTIDKHQHQHPDSTSV